MIEWNTVLMGLERYQDLLREAEDDRLVRQARANRFHGRVLIWLGQRLVVWGRLLQEHYGVTVEAPALQGTCHRY